MKNLGFYGLTPLQRSGDAEGGFIIPRLSQLNPKLVNLEDALEEFLLAKQADGAARKSKRHLWIKLQQLGKRASRKP